RRSDRAWLQEAPDTMTQVTWDGWVELPTETAQRLGVGGGGLVHLTPAPAPWPGGAACLSGGGPASCGGRGGDGAGARVSRRVRAEARDEHRGQSGDAPRPRRGAGLGRAAVSRREGPGGQGDRAPVARDPAGHVRPGPPRDRANRRAGGRA